jgi:hypothetical protein
MEKMADRILDQVRISAASMRIATEKKKLAAAFESLNTEELLGLSDKALAVWQAEYPAESPQAMFARHELQRRLVGEQVRATRFSAWVGLTGVVVGALLGSALTYLVSNLSKEVPQSTEGKKAGTNAEPASQHTKPSPEGSASQATPFNQLPQRKQ